MILALAERVPPLDRLAGIAQPLGVRVVFETSASRVFDLVAHEELSLIVVDLDLRNLDGLDVMHSMTEAVHARAVPFLVLSSEMQCHALMQAMEGRRVVDVLVKPFTEEELARKVLLGLNVAEHQTAMARDSLTPRTDGASERLSDRLVAAAPASEQAETVAALVRIYAALSADLDVANIAHRLGSEAMTLTKARGAAFHYRVGEAFQTGYVGELEASLRELAPPCSFLEAVFAGRGVVRHDDVRAMRDERAPRAIGSVIAVPVVARSGELDGALVLVHDAAYAFDTRDEELVVVSATYAASAFENARLFEQAQKARHRAELAEIALRAGEARLRIALEAAGLGTWDYNPLTDTLRWDVRCKALSGLSEDTDVSYRTFLDAIHPEDRARVDAAVQRALDPTTDRHFDIEYRTIGIEDAVERWVSARGLGISEHGRTVRFIGAMLDVTSKKRVDRERVELLASERRARAAAEAASRSKDEFLATVSHELRNPLNAILGWSRVLVEERDIDDARHRKGLEVILRNAKAQVQLVEDILEVSRIVTGKLRLSTGTVDVAAVIDAGVETVRAAAQAKRVQLNVKAEGELGTIVADEDRVQQIVWNLLSNAVKFTPSGGSVTVSAERSEDAVTITVRDSGEGIEPDFLPYVFDRFRQFDGSTTRRHGGLGLGLAIVRHLAELHGGTVRAESEGRGRGATFTVKLPLTAAHELSSESARSIRPAPARNATEPGTPLSRCRVIVVDDDSDMRDLIGMILEDAGAEVFVASTVATAIAELEAHVPDVAVSDLAMPGEDGYAFAQQVRASANEAARRVPLVAMTAYARAEDRRRVLAAGFDRHISKPIEPDVLVATLAAVIAGRRAE